MRDRRHRRLLLLNLTLLAVLAFVTLGPAFQSHAADADAQPAARGRGRYTVVTGSTQGTTTATLYVIDAANQELAALQWNRTNNVFDLVGYRDLSADSKRQQQPR